MNTRNWTKNNDQFENLRHQIDNYRIFVLCQDFDNFSLDDGPSTDDSSEDGTPNSLSKLQECLITL